MYDDVCLMIDGMHLKKQVTMDNGTNQLFGYTDIGQGPSSEMASEVLCLWPLVLSVMDESPSHIL